MDHRRRRLQIRRSAAGVGAIVCMAACGARVAERPASDADCGVDTATDASVAEVTDAMEGGDSAKSDASGLKACNLKEGTCFNGDTCSIDGCQRCTCVDGNKWICSNPDCASPPPHCPALPPATLDPCGVPDLADACRYTTHDLTRGFTSDDCAICQGRAWTISRAYCCGGHGPKDNCPSKLPELGGSCSRSFIQR